MPQLYDALKNSFTDHMANTAGHRSDPEGALNKPAHQAAATGVVNRYPRRRYGLLMACCVTLLWGFLPIFIKVAVANFAPTFVTGVRLIIAFVCLFLLLSVRGKRPWRTLAKPPLLAFATAACLLTNYLTYNVALKYGTPALAQTLIQTGALFLVFYGIVIFKEHLRPIQWLGIAIAALGLALFSEDYASSTPESVDFTRAALLIVFSGFAWATYAALQRHISQNLNPQQLNVLVFGLGSLFLLPLIEWPSLTQFSPGLIGLIIFLGLNTMLAYMALAEALQNAPIAQVSMIITLNPLMTLTGMRFVEQLGVPGIYPEPFGVVGYVGSLLVVAGVIVVVTKKEQPSSGGTKR